MAKNAAQIFADETTAHAFSILRVAAGMRENALAMLEELQAELVSKADKFAKLDSASSLAFKELEAQVAQIINETYKLIGKGQLRDLEGIAANENDFINTSMNKVFGGVKLFTKVINPKILEAVSGPIIRGHSSAEWWNGQNAALRSKFSAQMAMGILLGETGDQLIQRVRGTKKNGYQDGIMQVSRRDAAALALTSAQAVSNYARLESFKNRRTIKGFEWLATLDSRTTLICISLDGKQWRLPDLLPVGHNKQYPGPTAHWRCRSTITAVTYSWEELAGVKLPELDNQTLQAAVEEKLKADGKTPDQIAAALVNARASMDGQVSAGYNFERWAETKSDEFVSSVIGPGRFALWNAGQITFADLTDQSARPLTIAQLVAATQAGTPPAETLGVRFNPPPKKAAQAMFDLDASVKIAAEEATAKAEQAAKEAAEKLAIEQAAQKAADDARLAAMTKQASEAEQRLAAAELAVKEAEEITKKAEAEIAAQKAEAEEKAKKLKALGTKWKNGKPWAKKDKEWFDTLPAEEQLGLLDDWEELKAAKQAKDAAKAAKEAAKAAALAKTATEANQLAQQAARASDEAELVGIPHPDTLKFKQTLGGSTGARLMTAPDGSLWVLKTGASPDHVREEHAADTLYRALGAKVPAGGLFEAAAGPQKVTKFLEGSQTLAEAWTDPKRRAKIEAGLREQFAADVLLGNWDVIGMNRDNILVTPDNQVYRIDNGGSLRFRAMGSKKTGSEWDEIPRELWDMRDPAKNTQAAAFFGKLTEQDIANQVEAWPASLTGAIVGSPLPMEVKRVLIDRANELRLFAARTLDLAADGWTPTYAAKLTRAVWEMKTKGIRDALPRSLTSSASSQTTLLDAQGRAFYGLRKPPTYGATGDTVGESILAAVMTINHKAINGGIPNASKVASALSFKGLLKAYEASGDPDSVAKAKAYLPWIDLIEKHGKSTKPPNLGMFAPVKLNSGSQGRTQSVVADMWALVKEKHGEAGTRALEILRNWQSAQAGDSWSRPALVAKAWMQKKRPAGKWYQSGNDGNKVSAAIIEAQWKAAVKAVGSEDILDTIFTYQHALTQELLDTTGLPYVDKTLRAVRLIRTESPGTIAANGITPGKYADSVTLELGAVESHSLVQAYALYGDKQHATLAAVPFHRVIGSYLFERSPGQGGGSYAGEYENEFTADTSGIPKKYLSWSPAKYEGKGEEPATAWGVPLSHLRPRP